jgi:hypothetical protein
VILELLKLAVGIPSNQIIHGKTFLFCGGIISGAPPTSAKAGRPPMFQCFSKTFPGTFCKNYASLEKF